MGDLKRLQAFLIHETDVVFTRQGGRRGEMLADLSNQPRTPRDTTQPCLTCLEQSRAQGRCLGALLEAVTCFYSCYELSDFVVWFSGDEQASCFLTHAQYESERKALSQYRMRPLRRTGAFKIVDPIDCRLLAARFDQFGRIDSRGT